MLYVLRKRIFSSLWISYVIHISARIATCKLVLPIEISIPNKLLKIYHFYHTIHCNEPFKQNLEEKSM